MTRFLRFALIALVVCAMGSPAFAIHCTSCGAEGYCEWTPDSGTRCLEHIDYCEDRYSSCVGIAGQDTLADTFAVASVGAWRNARRRGSSPRLLLFRDTGLAQPRIEVCLVLLLKDRVVGDLTNNVLVPFDRQLGLTL